MTRPRIGITCDLGKRDFPEDPQVRDRHVLMDAYIEAVLKTGGIPLLLPCVADDRNAVAVLDSIDGLIISGGGHDIDPDFFGEERMPECGPPNSKRGASELAVCRGALARDMPVFGICGGMQVINVAAGGTLYQDIPVQLEDTLEHKPADESATYTFHEVEVFPSLLEETIGSETFTVNSHHHQSVKDLAPGMRLSAQSPDKVIEGIECSSHRFVIGVQWHPESMSAYGYGDSETAEHLFARFSDEARDYAVGTIPSTRHEVA